MADEVSFEVEHNPGYTLIRPTGYLDLSTSPKLREKILKLADERPDVLIVDLGVIEFLDSSALGVILNGWKVLNAEHSVLAVVSSQARITKIFEITALNLSIRLFNSVDDAVAELVGA